MKKTFLFIIFSISIASSIDAAEQYKYVGLDKFAPHQQQKLLNWLKVAQTATEKAIGKYPFPVEIHLAARKAGEPVPWANTRRHQTQSIHFYVDTRFSLQEFIDDWTSYHEISHLALPYLGSKNRWFAEGFASFMQYQVMHKAGILKKSIAQSYQFKLSPHLAKYQNEQTAMAIIQSLFKNKQYKAGYWASAWFFILADRQLKLQNRSMLEIVRRYQACCRMKDATLDDVLLSWDELAGSPIFKQLLDEFGTTKSRSVFPLKF